MARYTFPKQPNNTSYFREVVGEPRVDLRWQTVAHENGSGTVQVRWYGVCLNPSCTRALFATYPSGTMGGMTGHCGLMLMPVNVGTEEEPQIEDVRCCYYCSQRESRMEGVRTGARDARLANPKADLGPLVWPERTKDEEKAESTVDALAF